MTRAGWLAAGWCWASLALTIGVLSFVLVRLVWVATDSVDPMALLGLAQAFAIGLGLAVASVGVAALPAVAIAVTLDELLPPGPLVRIGRAFLAVCRQVPPLVVALVVLLVGLGAGHGYALFVLAVIALPGLAEEDRAALGLARRQERIAAASLGLGPLAIVARVVWPSTAPALAAAHVRAVGSIFGAATPLLLVDPSVQALSIVAVRRALGGELAVAAAAVLALLVGVATVHAVAMVVERPSRRAWVR